jgi:hypothetical protein
MSSPQKTKSGTVKSNLETETIPNELLSMDLSKIREFM